MGELTMAGLFAEQASTKSKYSRDICTSQQDTAALVTNRHQHVYRQTFHQILSGHRIAFSRTVRTCADHEMEQALDVGQVRDTSALTDSKAEETIRVLNFNNEDTLRTLKH
jgi:hypothetical protein